MQWRTYNTPLIVIVAFATALLAACRSKQTIVETEDFAQNLRSIAAHQRLSLDDTIKFFRFSETDSGTVMVPEAVVYRTTRAERAGHIVDTAAAVAHTSQKTSSSIHKQPTLPSWANETTYTLTIGVLLLLLITYLARKT